MTLLDICVFFQPFQAESSLFVVFMVFIGLVMGSLMGFNSVRVLGGILSQVWEGVWGNLVPGWGVFSGFREGLNQFK